MTRQPFHGVDALETIVAGRRASVEADKRRMPLENLKTAPGPRRSLVAALRRPGLSLIAEVKPASPSRGDIQPEADCAAIVSLYEQAGARAISVLTEPNFFGGSLESLTVARAATSLPVMCKDFIFDSYQIHQAAAAGADAVLLIAAMLSDDEQTTLIDAAHWLGLEVLYEAMSADELDRVLASRADVVGINNRNLRTLEVDLNLSLELAPRVDDGRPVVAESGVFARADVVRLEKAGVDGILVGTALMESPDIRGKIGELMGWVSAKE